jgi:hypothetical protein
MIRRRTKQHSGVPAFYSILVDNLSMAGQASYFPIVVHPLSNPTNLANGPFTSLEGDYSSNSFPTNNSPNCKHRKAPPYIDGGSLSMELLKSLLKPLFTYCRERIKGHYCPLYPLLWHRSPLKKQLHGLNMERKT